LYVKQEIYKIDQSKSDEMRSD